MTRRLNLVLVVLVAVVAGELGFSSWAASRARPPVTLLDTVRADIERQYHDCIPLGWYAERLPSGTYFPSVNLDIVDNDGPFQALWVGIVPPGRALDPRVADVKSVMDQLVAAGILRRGDDARGDRYNVTRYGRQFYYDADEVTGNEEDWPYVCYSRLRVTRIAWDPSRPDEPGTGRSIVKHAVVSWTAEPFAGWATAALRAHAVQLRPATNPAEATVCRYPDGEWAILPFGTARRARC